MSQEENKAAVRRFWDGFNAHNLDEWAEVTTPNFMNHDPSLPVQHANLATTQEMIGGLQAAFPDLKSSEDDLISEGDKIVVGAATRTDGRLIIRDGGVVNGGAFVSVGSSPGSTGVVIVDGLDSLFTIRGVDEDFGFPAFMHVGREGTGLLDIRNGGRVLFDPLGMPGDFPGLTVGRGPGGERTGVLLIDGDDGISQPSELRVANGNRAFFQAARDDGTKATVNITRGGRLIIENPDGLATSFIGRKVDKTTRF